MHGDVGKLTVQLRSSYGKGAARRLRAAGTVPGICYGETLEQPLAISVHPKELKAALDPAKRRNTVLQVTIEGGAERRELAAMLKDFQVHPISRAVVHVDLLAIDVNKEVVIEVPVHMTGKAKGTVDGGLIHVVRHSVLVACKPSDIPIGFDLDIAPLGIGDALHVTDMRMPAGVRIAMAAGTTIVTCVAPKAEKVEAAVEGEAAVAAEGVPAEGAAKVEGAAAAPAAAAAGEKGKPAVAAEKPKPERKQEKGGDKRK